MFAPLNSRRSVAAILMITAFSPLAAHGGPVAEVEPNDSLASAQNIDAAFTLDFNPIIQDGMGTNTSTLIPHASIIGGGDPALTPDYFSFTVNDAGLSGVFDVDSGSVFSDTALYLFDSAGNLLAPEQRRLRRRLRQLHPRGPISGVHVCLGGSVCHRSRRSAFFGRSGRHHRRRALPDRQLHAQRHSRRSGTDVDDFVLHRNRWTGSLSPPKAASRRRCSD